jgi:hypothetical protein
MLAGLLVALLSVSAQAQTHFDDISGDPMSDAWTLYLTNVTFDGDEPEAGDELAIFDGNLLVGVHEFTGTESFGNNQNNPVIVFSEVTNAGNDYGYTPGNDVTFKYWDGSTEIAGIFSADDVYNINPGDGNYFESGADAPTFPSDEEHSYISLDFNTGGSISGNVTLDNTCNGIITEVLVEVRGKISGDLYGTDYADEDGDYTVNGITLPSSGTSTYTVDAILDNHNSNGPKEKELGPGGSTSATANFNLTAHTGEISGNISYNGDNIESADVTLYDSDDSEIASDVTGTGGNYTFNNICVGDYYITIEHDDYEAKTSDEFALTNNDDLTKDFTLEPLPGSITGVVFEGAVTNPIEGAYVKVFNQDTPPVELYSTTTNADGEYEFTEVPVGTYDVKAGGTIGDIIYGAQTKSATVDANAETVKNFNLSAIKGNLSGLVRSSVNSELIDGVLVDLLNRDDGSRVDYDHTDDGAYSITDIDPGIYDVEFSKAGYETRLIEYVHINSDEETELNAYLEEEPGEIKIAVQDGGTNITGATVTIGSGLTATFNYPWYKFTNIALGSYEVLIEHDDYRNTSVEVELTMDNTPVQEIVPLEAYEWESISGANTMADLWTIFLQNVTIDGEPAEVNDEVAIYDDNNLVGVYHIENPLNTWNATNQDLRAYSDISGGTGYTAGNEYTFKFYDASSGSIIKSPTVTLSDPNSSGAYTGYVFPANSPHSFVTLDFRAEETQTIQLEQGYQMISSRILMDNMDMHEVMNNGLDNNKNKLVFVKNYLGYKYKYFSSWSNNIGDWKVEQGYLVKMSADDEFSMTGTPVNPQREIDLVSGFNLISYFPTTSMDVATVFADIKDDLIFVRNSQGEQYWEVGENNWVNNIGNMNPGEGYFVKTSAATTLVYPTAKGSAGIEEGSEPQHFTFSGGDATEPVYTIYIESDKLEAGDEIAAFDGDIMVGSTVIDDPADAYANDMNLFSIVNDGEGYKAGNTISFKVWSPRTDEEYTNIEVDYLNPSGDAHTDNTFPEGEGAYSIIKASVAELDVPELDRETSMNVYPNPATNNLFINTEEDMTQIRVLNTTGQVIMTKQINNNEYTLNVNGLDAGIYILQTTFKDRQSSLRFAVK